MTERALRLLDLMITLAIWITGVVMWLVLPWSTRGWVVPIVVAVNLLNTLAFVLLRRYARQSRKNHLSGLTIPR